MDDGLAARSPHELIDTFRIIMLASDRTAFYASTERMSNEYIPVTLVVGDSQAFHHASVRQVGSRWIRPNSGYQVRLGPDTPFYGVHDSIRFDFNGLGEIVMKQMLNRAGGSQSSLYDDISYLIAPRAATRA